MKVTRIAYSDNLNTGKQSALAEQTRRLGRVRRLVWDRYGSLSGVGVTDRGVRDQWLADGTAEQFGVLANAWKETLRDTIADIAACREAAKVPVRKSISRVDVHYQIDAASMPSSQRPCGAGDVGVDKGYTEALVDSQGNHHGDGLGELLSVESDHRKQKGQRRAKLRALAQKELATGNQAKHDRIVANNLGTVKRQRRARRMNQRVRTLCFTAVHQVVDHANHMVAEDLTKPFAARHSRGPNTNRRLNQWTKGTLGEALSSVSERRSSALTLVNAAYTSQVAPCCGRLGNRAGDRLHCTRCGDMWQADHAAAINILQRYGDPDISPWTPHQRVKRIVADRDRRSEETAPPGLQLTNTKMSGERNIPNHAINDS